jgi:hypothetical protein
LSADASCGVSFANGECASSSTSIETWTVPGRNHHKSMKVRVNGSHVKSPTLDQIPRAPDLSSSFSIFLPSPWPSCTGWICAPWWPKPQDGSSQRLQASITKTRATFCA